MVLRTNSQRVCGKLAEKITPDRQGEREYSRCNDDSCSWYRQRAYSFDFIGDLVQPAVKLLAEHMPVV